jgi:hypothetical protein
MNPMTTENKEFWGITSPSLLACFGSLLSIGGSWLWLEHTLGIAVGVIGLIMIGLALRANLINGFNVKWRKTNFIMHAVTFVLSLIILCITGVLRYITAAS